jgi:hypothetical protein
MWGEPSARENTCYNESQLSKPGRALSRTSVVVPEPGETA